MAHLVAGRHGTRSPQSSPLQHLRPPRAPPAHVWRRRLPLPNSSSPPCLHPLNPSTSRPSHTPLHPPCPFAPPPSPRPDEGPPGSHVHRAAAAQRSHPQGQVDQLRPHRRAGGRARAAGGGREGGHVLTTAAARRAPRARVALRHLPPGKAQQARPSRRANPPRPAAFLFPALSPQAALVPHTHTAPWVLPPLSRPPQEGDAFLLVFHDAIDAVSFCLQVGPRGAAPAPTPYPPPAPPPCAAGADDARAGRTPSLPCPTTPAVAP